VRRTGDVLAVAGLFCLLGGWLGALLLFGVVVAPTAFRVLPGPEMAGKLVGPVLGSLNRYGIGAGVALAGIARILGRRWLLTVLPLAMAAMACISEFGITAAIARVRPLAFGPDPDPAALARFGQLHGLSVALFGITGVTGLFLVWLHARAEVAARRTP
jgi:hypothetical protein